MNFLELILDIISMHTLNLFINFVIEHRYLGYTVLFFAMIFEGELFLVATGILVGLNAFDPFDAFFFAFAGVLAGDMLWYWLGRYLAHRHFENKFVVGAIYRVKKILPGLERNPAHVIFLSKFIYGLNHTTILVLGFLKVEFRQFIRTQFFTSLFWSLIFLPLGILFGGAAITYAHSLDKFILVVVVSFVALIIAERVVRKFLVKAQQKHN